MKKFQLLKPQSVKKPSNSFYWKGIFAGLVSGVLLFGFLMMLGMDLPLNDFRAAAEQSLTDFETTITGTVDKTKNAVVSVDNYQVQYGGGRGGIFDGYFGSPGQGINLDEFDQTPQLVGSGSGVVYKIDKDKAYIVTNNHVIEGSDKLEVQMANGKKTEAELIGSDVYSDLAVLTIPAKYADGIIEFADSNKIQVGSIAIAIGSPMGTNFASSVTQGIVSGLNRQVPVDTDGDHQDDWEMNLIQTDAAINPGNSGGALVNSKAQLIGINSSKLASAAVEGMGFAIPSNDVKNIVKQLEETGEVVRPVLGISAADLNMLSIESRVKTLGLKEDQVDGVVVVKIMPRSSADGADIQKYDVITKINDDVVKDNQSLKQALFKCKIGDTIKVTLFREGKEKVVEVKLNDTITANELRQQ